MVVLTDLHIAGGMIRVHHDGPCPWMETYEAFTHPRPDPQFKVELFIESGELRRPLGVEDFVYQRMDLNFGMNSERTQAKGISNGSESAFLALLELTLQGIISRLGGILVHAAGCVVHGKAWLVAGPSGTGKSTAAREAGFAKILSDERVAVLHGSQGWCAWGTPFWSSGQTLPMNPESMPLGGIIKLVKNPDFYSSVLDSGAALVHLMESITLYETCPEARTRAFAAAHEIVTHYPGFEINTPRRLAWASSARWAA